MDESKIIEKTEEFFRQLGLTTFSSRMIVSFLQSRLSKDGGYERFIHFIKYLLLSLNNEKVVEGIHPLQYGCPNLIPGLQSQSFWDTTTLPWIKVLEDSFSIIKSEFFSMKSQNSFQVGQSYIPYINQLPIFLAISSTSIRRRIKNRSSWSTCDKCRKLVCLLPSFAWDEFR